MKRTITAEIILGIETRNVTVRGQYARMLAALIEAGAKGVTSLDVSRTWALRTSHYIHILRRDHGLPIRMTWEAHDGASGPGRHGRYHLDAPARIIADTEKREAA